MNDNALFGIFLTLIAGGSTTLGAIIGVMNKKPGKRFISLMMAFSAGVMVFISFTEMFVPATEILEMPLALLMLIIGMGVGLGLDFLIPEAENIHEHYVINGGLDSNSESIPDNIQRKNLDNGYIKGKSIKRFGGGDGYGPRRRRMRKGKNRNNKFSDKLYDNVKDKKIMRLGFFTVVALFIHNLPEGLATFSASFINPTLGIEIALATALHNIPEGISVAIPIYSASGSRKKGILYSTMSGLAEPFGALLAWLFLAPILNERILMSMLAFTAGIMIYISVDVLIPQAKILDHKHDTVIGFLMGMVVMGISLIFL